MARHLQVFANDCAGMGRFHRRNFGLESYATGLVRVTGKLDRTQTAVQTGKIEPLEGLAPKSFQDDMIGKTFLSLSPAGDLPCIRFTFVHFSNLAWPSDSEKWPNRGLAAGTLQFVGRVPKRPRMFAARNSFPRSLSIFLIAS
jgi:hypothetical protein